MHDLRYAVRTLLRSPAFTLAAIATLALAIGASTAVFSVASGVLLEPLGYAQPDRIVRLVARNDQPSRYDTISYPDYLDVVAQAGVFTRGAAFDEWSPAVSGVASAEVLNGAGVDSGFFDVLGIRPARGRFFIAAEDKAGNDTTVVISHGLWQRMYGGDDHVVGRTMLLDGRTLTIVGITPRGFEHPYLSDDTKPIDVWTTLGIDPATNTAPRDGHSFTAIARLRDGVTLEAAQARVDAVAKRLEELYPEDNTGRGIRLVPLHARITSGVRGPLTILFAAVLLLLAIACVNVANLVLARTSRRAGEIAVRAAIGATPKHLIRQLLAETFVLAAIGGAAGAGLAYLLVGRVVALAGSSIPRATEIAVDARVLVFVLIATIVTAAAVGLVPALQLARGRVVMKPNVRGVTASASSIWAQSSLVVAQVAISVVLLTGAALVGRSLGNLLTVDKGINERGAVVFDIRAPRTTFAETAKITAFYRELLPRLAAIPGVKSAGATTILPLNADYNCNGFTIDGAPPLPQGSDQCAESRSITAGYFDAIGMQVIAGRGITARDDEKAPPVIVIDEAFAKQYWPGRSPLGQRITTQRLSHEVVGIVRSARIMSLAEAPVPAMYVSHAQAQTYRSTSIVLRTDAGLDTIAPAIRAAVAAVSPDAPVMNIRTLADAVGSSVATQRFQALLLSGFGLAALLLATVGIAGMLAYTTSRREREIGVRMALGATAREIVALVVGGGVKLVALGLGIGVLIALATNRFLQSMLFGVGAADPLSLGAVALLLVAAGALAASIPALRAAKTDPMTVMRSE